MNLVYALKDGQAQFDKDRSDKMVENFLAVYDLAPQARYFGHLATPAVMHAEHLGFDWFASAIQLNRPALKGRVTTALYTYEDCERLVFVGGKPEKERLDLFKFDDRAVIRAVSQPYTIFSFFSEDNIFEDTSVIFEKDFNGPVTDYFQYLVVLNGSAASEPVTVDKED